MDSSRATSLNNYSSPSSSSEKSRGLGSRLSFFKRRASPDRKGGFPSKPPSRPRLSSRTDESSECTDSSELSLLMSQQRPPVLLSSRCLLVRTQSESLKRTYSESKKIAQTKALRFSQVEVRLHGMVLGDNPAVSSGPPLTLEWQSFDSHALSLDSFETNKPLQARAPHEMIVPKSLREEWIRNAGFPRSEVVRIGNEIRRIKRSRAAEAEQSAKLHSWVNLFRKKSTLETAVCESGPF
jgi:hypothetical protein